MSDLFQRLAEGTLLRKARNGDPDAAWKLLEPFREELTGYYARRMAADAEVTAKDFAHIVLAAAYEGLAEFRGESTVRTWVFGIALNQIRGEIRRKARHRAREEKLDTPHGDDNERQIADPAREEAIVERQEFARRIVTCMRTCLDEEEFRILILHIVQEKTFEEIGGILKIKAATVRTKAVRARAKQDAYIAAREPDLLALPEDWKNAHQIALQAKDPDLRLTAEEAQAWRDGSQRGNTKNYREACRKIIAHLPFQLCVLLAFLGGEGGR